MLRLSEGPLDLLFHWRRMIPRTAHAPAWTPRGDGSRIRPRLRATTVATRSEAQKKMREKVRPRETHHAFLAYFFFRPLSGCGPAGAADGADGVSVSADESVLPAAFFTIPITIS